MSSDAVEGGVTAHLDRTTPSGQLETLDPKSPTAAMPSSPDRMLWLGNFRSWPKAGNSLDPDNQTYSGYFTPKSPRRRDLHYRLIK